MLKRFDEKFAIFVFNFFPRGVRIYGTKLAFLFQQSFVQVTDLATTVIVLLHCF